MSELILKSPRDGSVLTFSNVRRTGEDREFDHLVKTRAFTGRVTASTYSAGSPIDMFSSMAEEWQGWSGEKKWADLEERVVLLATSDSTGHIQLKVQLRGDVNFHDRLEVSLFFDAGQLDAMARDVAAALA